MDNFQEICRDIFRRGVLGGVLVGVFLVLMLVRLCVGLVFDPLTILLGVGSWVVAAILVATWRCL